MAARAGVKGEDGFCGIFGDSRKNFIKKLDFAKYAEYITYHDQGAVAQLARAIRSHRIGRGFESLQLHHFFTM